MRKEVADLADDDFVVVRRVGADMFVGSAARCPATEPDVPWTGEEDVDKWSDLSRDAAAHVGMLAGDSLFDPESGLVARTKRMAAELAAATRRPETWSISSLENGAMNCKHKLVIEVSSTALAAAVRQQIEAGDVDRLRATGEFVGRADGPMGALLAALYEAAASFVEARREAEAAGEARDYALISWFSPDAENAAILRARAEWWANKAASGHQRISTAAASLYRASADLAEASATGVSLEAPQAWSLPSIGQSGPRMLEDDGVARVSLEADGFLGLRSRMH